MHAVRSSASWIDARARTCDGRRPREPSSFLRSFLRARRTQRVLQDIPADTLALERAGFLIEAVVNTAVDASVIDIVRDLLEGCVVQDDLGHGRMSQRDVVTVAPELLFEHCARGGAEAGVTGGIRGEG